MKKEYTIIKRKNGSERRICGTLDELVRHFGIGSAKNITQLLSRVIDEYDRREASCYHRSFFTLEK